MAEVFQESTWNGVAVDTYTDTTTGSIKVYQKGFAPLGGVGGVLIAESVPANGKSDWTLVNKDRYRRAVNRERDKNGESILSEQEFVSQFFSSGARKFNNDRAFLLNKPGTSSQSERQGFFDNRVPFTSNPTGNKERVNFDQSITDQTVVDPTAKPEEQKTGDSDGTVELEVIPQSTGADGDESSDNSNQNTDSDAGTSTDSSEATADGSGTTTAPTDGDGTTTSTIENINQSTLATKITAGGTNELLKYPLIAPPPGMQYDYIQITAFQYTPSGLTPSANRATQAISGKQYETIQLPMQPTITESNAVSWTNDTINDIQRAFGNVSSGVIDFLGKGSKDRLTNALSQGSADIKNLFSDPTTEQALVAFFAGQAVNANLIGRSTGAIINPNLELLFSGPGLRSFNFTFRLTPRNIEESEVIRKIIRAFKRNSAVQTATSALFLKSPRIFQLEYIYKDGGQHPYLNKFKPCALTNFAVNYTPDGSYMVFNDTGSLTAYDIQLSFTEIIPVYANDYDDSETDMGF